jgi:hypothetical protein
MTVLAELLQTRSALSKKLIGSLESKHLNACASAIYRPSNFFTLLPVYHLMCLLYLYYFPSVDFLRQSRCGVFAATVSSLTVTPAIKLIFNRIWLNTTGTVRHPLLLIYWLYTTIDTVLSYK